MGSAGRSAPARRWGAPDVACAASARLRESIGEAAAALIARLAPVSLAVLLILCSFGCAGGGESGTFVGDRLSALNTRSRPVTMRVPTRTRAHPGVGIDIAAHTFAGDRSSHIVFVHGLLADSRTWRLVVEELETDSTVTLVDLPGCGESDAPNPHEVGDDVYSPYEMGERVLLALRASLATMPEDGRLTLVGHSLGGAVVIRCLCDPSLSGRFGDVVARVDRAVLFSPLDVVMERPIDSLRALADADALTIDIANLTGVLSERIRESFPRGSTFDTGLIEEETRGLVATLSSTNRRLGAQAMLRAATAWDKNMRPDWVKMEGVASMYANLRQPVLILWGSRDEVLPVSMGYKLATQFVNAHFLVLNGRSHAPQIESPGDCARAIDRFVATGAIPELPGTDAPIRRMTDRLRAAGTSDGAPASGEAGG